MPSSAAQLKRMPLIGNGEIAKSARVLIPLTRGHGSARLKTFVPTGELLLQFDCAGPGSFRISSTDGVVDNTLARCSTSFGVTTLTVEGNNSVNGKKCPTNFECGNGYADTALTLEISAAPTTSWEILVAETTVWFPVTDIRQADAQPLLGPTFGAGSTTLQAFTVAPDESIRGNVLCSSSTPGRTSRLRPTPFGRTDSRSSVSCTTPPAALPWMSSGPTSTPPEVAVSARSACNSRPIPPSAGGPDQRGPRWDHPARTGQSGAGNSGRQRRPR